MTRSLFALAAVPALALAGPITVALPAGSGSGAPPMSQVEPAVAAVGADHFIVTWSDFRASSALSNIWALGVRENGTALEQETVNLPLWPSRGGQVTSNVACGPTSCLVTWLEAQATVRAIRVDRQLQRLDAAPLDIYDCVAQCGVPHVVFDGAGWLVTVVDSDLFARRVSLTGLLDPMLLDLGAASFAADAPAATDGLHTVIVWLDANGGLASGGVVAGTDTPVAVHTVVAALPSPIDSYALAASPDAGYYVVWREQLSTGDPLLGERMASDGTAVAPVLIINFDVKGAAPPPLWATGSSAQVIYWSTSAAELDETTVSLVDGTVGATRTVSLGGFAAEYAAAALPTGELLMADDAANLNDDVALLAIDGSPLHAVDGGPTGALAQVDAVAAWTGAQFVVVVFEEADQVRQPFALTVSSAGAVGPRMPLSAPGATPFDPAAVSDGDGGVVLMWHDYQQLGFTHLDPALNPSPVSEATLSQVGFATASLAFSGGTAIAAIPTNAGSCMVLNDDLYGMPSTAWRSLCDTTELNYSAMVPAGNLLGVLTEQDPATIAFVTLPLPLAAPSPPALFNGATTLISTAAFSRVPALATDGSGFLAVWWENSYDLEAVNAALISSAGVVSMLPQLSSRPAPDLAQRPPLKLGAAFDGVRYWAAYTAPADGGGFDAFVRQIDGDGGLGSEQAISTGYDEEIEALVAGSAGRVLLVTRAFDAAAQGMRMTARIFADVPPGAPCFAPSECSVGMCSAGICGLAQADGGDGGSGSMGDGGSLNDAGTDAGTDATSDGGSARGYGVRCGCGAGASAELSLALLLLLLLGRLRRAPARAHPRRSQLEGAL